MPSEAMSFASVDGVVAFASHDVLGQMDRLKVPGVHARSIAAKVVDVKSVGDWPYVVFV